MEAAAGPRLGLARPAQGRWVAGVAAGIARRFDIDPLIVRVALVALGIATGVGFVIYGVAWLLMPSDEGAPPLAERVSRMSVSAPASALSRRWGKGTGRISLGIGFLVLAALLGFRELGIWWSDAFVWPLVLAAAGVTVIWRVSQGGDAVAEEAVEAPPAGSSPQPASARLATPRAGAAARGAFGVALVVGAGLLFLYANGALAGRGGDVMLATFVVVAAVALILAPLWWRLARGLSRERAARIRSQERADVAAHLHDSVLQTLALVQRRADDPRAVAALARRQERELRTWLWGAREGDNGDATLVGRLEAAAAQVEDAHGVAVEVVAVGDAPLGEPGDALVAAAREAMVNAAKFAGEAGPVAVFAEVSDGGAAHVFVRDRGPGFDPDALPDDRRGVRDSIIGRMERHGGSACIRSAPGEGAEVELDMELRR